jgi:predicted Zn-dependent peptidase
MKHTQFANGFQVIYEKPDSTIPISSVQIICNVGSIHSPTGLNGATHFIEHMCFKGTNYHPDFNKVIMQYVDSGSVYNGFTTQRYTAFVVKCPDVFLPQCIKILAEELLHSTFALTEFKKEEKVVKEETIINNENPKHLLNNMSNELLYENTPYQYPVDDISYHQTKYDYKKVVDFYKQHYKPSNMIFSITSNLAFSSIVNMLKTTVFNKKDKTPMLSLHDQMLPYFLTPPKIDGPKYNLRHVKKLNATFLTIAFQICNQYDKDKYILNFFASILCNSLTGRLSKILRQDYGLVYSIIANTTFYECGGDLTITTQFNADSFIKKNKPSVLPLIIQELNKILKTGLTASEITIFKHNIRGRILMDLENSDTQTYYNGYALLYQNPDEIVPYTDLYKTYYEPITKAQLNACIRHYICLERMCVSVIGNQIPTLPVIEKECNKLH